MDNQNKIIAVAAYVTPLGWIVAMAVRYICADRTEFTTFHLRQALGLSILETLSYVLFVKIFDQLWLVHQILCVVFFWMAVIGIRCVFKNLRRYQPFLGHIYDKYFGFIA